MRDLNQIIQQNSEACAREIPRLISAGKFVVAEYAGLAYVNHERYDTAEAAQAGFDAACATANPDERFVLISPSRASAAAHA